MNGAFVTSTPMPHEDTASKNLSTVVAIPHEDMRPFSNSLNMKFVFQIAKKGHCQDTAPMNLQGAILKQSYLDIGGIPHWVQLPNLEIFANAGYPFTRRADLSDTAVVLPDTPQPEEIEMYLTMMGHFGAQTGYPVLDVTVTNSQGMNGTKDYLVMGMVDDSPAISKLNSSLPVSIKQDGLKIQDTNGFFERFHNAWWKVRSSDHVESGKLEISGTLPDALIEGLEYSGHSVVLIALKDKSVVPNFLNVFLNTSQSSDISQSVSVLNGTRFVSYRIGNNMYYAGSLSWPLRLSLLLHAYPWLVVLIVVVICFLIAALLRAVLRRHARHRLQASE